ncbi:unnamed protein product [Penicillium roqueforti FM164]|uniref:Genomic scaffold, ProqFM164S01 n=1 Tax=Penicillium roqueforti (strain FM164) TaxID=1365484 RepID=W6QGT1_PENRF|nr:unnamed protein product [Penicillium roqueforti FM164]
MPKSSSTSSVKRRLRMLIHGRRAQVISRHYGFQNTRPRAAGKVLPTYMQTNLLPQTQSSSAAGKHPNAAPITAPRLRARGAGEINRLD